MKHHDRRFDIDAIAASLRTVQADFETINDRVDNRRESMTDELVDNILTAYRHLNGLLEKRVSLFSPAGLGELLELNHIILCGNGRHERTAYYRHIEATRARFGSVIKDIYIWYKKKAKNLGCHKRAARFYVKTLSQPQLFLEGNHRTGNIIVNYILFCDGEPPFILDKANALAYFNPSTRIKYSRKASLMDNLVAVPGYAKEFRKLLERYGDEKYLI